MSLQLSPASFVATLALAWLVTGCAAPECQPGTQQPCACAATASYRICGTDKEWGPCMCEWELGEDGVQVRQGDAGGSSSTDLGTADAGGISPRKDTASGGPNPLDAMARVIPEQCNGVDDDGDGGVDEWESSSNPSCRVSVAAGTYLMGCQGGDPDCEDDESPAVEVSLGAFEIDRTEVTQGAWEACVEAGACPAPPEHYDPQQAAHFPVVMITRSEAEQFCAWRGGRLATEAEWERVASGAKGRRWPWGNAAPTCERANIDGCGGAPLPVGSFAAKDASVEGVFGLAGNVAEWVADNYQGDVYQSYVNGAVNPWVKSTGPHLVRGGSMYWPASQARSWNRMPIASAKRYADVGLRCVYPAKTP